MCARIFTDNIIFKQFQEENVCVLLLGEMNAIAPAVFCETSMATYTYAKQAFVDMDISMDISVDIHGKSVDMDMDMDGKFHINGKLVKHCQ